MNVWRVVAGGLSVQYLFVVKLGLKMKKNERVGYRRANIEEYNVTRVGI